MTDIAVPAPDDESAAVAARPAAPQTPATVDMTQLVTRVERGFVGGIGTQPVSDRAAKAARPRPGRSSCRPMTKRLRTSLSLLLTGTVCALLGMTGPATPSSVAASSGLVGHTAAGRKAAGTGSMLDALNAQRRANGIPAVTWNADWASKCHTHNLFEQSNKVFGHAEDPSLPGYSEDGNWAGTHSVLSGGGSWLPNPDAGSWWTPFEWAPIHLIQMLTPSITEVGGDQIGTNGLSCLTTWPGYDPPPATDTPTFYSYPGNDTTGIYASEQARESPTTPEAELGLGAVATTGPNIFVYAEGFDSQTLVSSAALTDDSGRATELVWWDAKLNSLEGYNPGGSVMLIPKKELIGRTHYKVSLTLADPRRAKTEIRYNRTTRKFEEVVVQAAYTAQASYSFGFTTGPCATCRHLPDKPTGLIGLRAGTGLSLIVTSNGQSGRVSFTVSHLRAGVRVKNVCRTGLSARQARGHSRCSVWSLLGRFSRDTSFDDGETTVSVASLLGERAFGRYRVTARVSGSPVTVTLPGR